MKQFSIVVFGGLAVVVVGIAVSWSAGWVWQHVPHPSFASLALTRPALVRTTSNAATSGSVFSRKITYTADEEEDLVNSAVSSLRDTSGRITASAYIVKDLTTGQTWTEYDSERLKPIASLTKLVTAEVARRTIPKDAVITLTPAITNTFGNTAGFIPGETFTADQLMYPLLMVSSNDAAEALARRLGRTKFLKEMNNFMQQIGAYRTYFDDPSGLSPLNVSTASDMVTILEWLRKNDPEVLNLTLTRTKTIRSHTWINPTHFLSWSYYLGGKNGFTDEAKKTGAVLLELGPVQPNGKKDVYAIVVLGSDNRDEDVIRLINKVK
ncbi:MAG TPA: serine hydrolase [Candidatus Paceibacterota bacterium]